MPGKNDLQPHPEPQPIYFPTADDETSLGDLVANLWRNRSAIIVFSMLAFFLVALLGLGTYFFQERYEITSQEFKLEFDGVDKNEYPSGLKFSTADILATPILKIVYDQNNLENLLDFDEFKSGLTVSQTNETIELLEYEYAAILSNTKLSFEERDKIEAAFLQKKRDALLPVYTLSLRLPRKIYSLSEGLRAKILSDTLATWAEAADRSKGANKYQLFLVSPNIIDRQKVEQEDYLIGVDILRANILRIGKDIEKVMAIPGASAIRTQDTQVNLQDLVFRMDDLQRFRLNQMVGLLRATGISRDKDIAGGYLNNQIFELKLKKEKAQASLGVYENSLQQYMSQERFGGQGGSGFNAATTQQQGIGRDVASVIPQFSGTFLENLQKMSEENSDNAYRQEIINNVTKMGLEAVEIDWELRWYNELLAKIKLEAGNNESAKRKTEAFQAKSAKLLSQIFDEVFSATVQTINELNAIYLELSRHNLNPASILYTQTEPPLTTTESAISLTKLVMLGVLSLLIAEGAIFIGILLKESVLENRKGKI